MADMGVQGKTRFELDTVPRADATNRLENPDYGHDLYASSLAPRGALR